MAGVDPLAHAIAGGGASVLSLTLMYPLDSMRTRLQVNNVSQQQVVTHMLTTMLCFEGDGRAYVAGRRRFDEQRAAVANRAVSIVLTAAYMLLNCLSFLPAIRRRRRTLCDLQEAKLLR